MTAARIGTLLIAASALWPAVAAAQPVTEPVTEPVAEPVTEPGTVPDPVPAPDTHRDGEVAPAYVVEASDADLAALGLDDAVEDPHLNIYGFMDILWSDAIAPRHSAWGYTFPTESSFAVGNLNLYLTRALSDRWRSFLEVRFTYAPAGSTNSDGTFVATTAPDQSNGGSPMTWGGVNVERAYIEYDATTALTVQVGSFLTPYGIWNVDHGSPAIVPITPPWIVSEALFPKQQTGVHLYGERTFGAYTLGYHATFSNGRGPMQAYRDLDGNKAIGGHLELRARWFGSTKLGVSGYHGRYTDRPSNQLAIDATGTPETIVPPGVSYDESSLGADLLVEHGPLRVQAEVLANQRDYRAGAREQQGGGFVPNNRFVGGYVLAGYRFDRWWQVMPFVEVEAAQPRTEPLIGAVNAYIGAVGVNLRPVPSVVLKIQYNAVEVTHSPYLHGVMQIVAMQAAWAF